MKFHGSSGNTGRGEVKCRAEGRVHVFERQQRLWRDLWEMQKRMRGWECCSAEDTSTSGCKKSLLSLGRDSNEERHSP